jgi:hypothetical protein
VNVDKDSEGEASESVGGAPDPDDVKSRAAGRPPEERSSEDPTAQAETVLQDSEDRTSDGAERSDL